MLANPLTLSLERLHAEIGQRSEGAVATYIPELGLANPAHFGIAVATADGHLYSVGDSQVPFTIQSISKPFVYGQVLDELGLDTVLAHIGVEPSGEAFNAISLEPGTGRPRNPMINAGAITAAGLVRGCSQAERFGRTMAMLTRYAGHSLDVDESVFRSEEETGHRNRAIGHLLRNAGILDGDVDEACGRYFRQCSVLVNAEDLAMMAATLANGGVNPRTGERALNSENVERVLAVMSSCGMYDAAGSWVYRVGMPAKSGVGGGIIAVLPGQLGIGVFSPPLDDFGNSVRGVAVCEALSREFALHLLRPPLNIDSVMRSTGDIRTQASTRRRAPADVALIEQTGARAKVFQLQGPLVFSTAELALRHALDRVEPGDLAIVDTRRVTGLEPSVARLISVFVRELANSGGVTLFTLDPSHPWAQLIQEAASSLGVEAGLRFVPSLDAAIEWCEDAVLAAAGSVAMTGELSMQQHPLAVNLPPANVAELRLAAKRVTFAPGERIIAQGATADVVYLLTAGLVEVSVPSASGRPHRLATLGPGTTFGEMALIDHGTRSANVDAVSDTVCIAVPVDRLPGMLRLKLVEALARDLADRLRRANGEIAVLAG